MNIELIIAIGSSSVITALITTVGSRYLRKSQSKSLEAQAAELWSKTYSGLIKELNDQLGKSKKMLTEQQEELDKLRKLNADLEATRENLIQEIHSLEEELESLRKQLSKLTARLKKYEENKG
ncbi:MAG: hypothetical protein ABJG41_10030 [Cyclobacteriaceae bacterium]